MKDLISTTSTTPSVQPPSVEQAYLTYLRTPKWDEFKQDSRKPLRSNTIREMIKACQLEDPLLSRQHLDSIQIALDQNQKVWVWSDQHFGHKNIIRYTDRPFDSVESMNEAMFQNYRQVVGDDDWVIFGGDLAFFDPKLIDQRFQSLPGRKILILGNHEFNHTHYTRFECMASCHLAASFKIIREGEVWDLWVTHLPIDAHLLPPRTLNLHGHIHEKVRDGHLHVNMSVEHLNYQPVLLQSLIR